MARTFGGWNFYRKKGTNSKFKISCIYEHFILLFQSSIANWNKVWYVTIAILLVETTFYSIFASGEVQSWNDGSNITKKNKIDEENLEEANDVKRTKKFNQ